jgi:hypothetical protein
MDDLILNLNRKLKHYTEINELYFDDYETRIRTDSMISLLKEILEDIKFSKNKGGEDEKR